MASSLICATNRLSTMLYRELTSMEITLGSAMDNSSGSTGRSFIKVSFIDFSLLTDRKWKKTAKKPHNGFFEVIVWRKVAYCCKNPHEFY